MCTYTTVERFWFVRFIHENLLYLLIPPYVFLLVLFRSSKFVELENSMRNEGYSSELAVEVMRESLIGKVDYSMILHKKPSQLNRYSRRVNNLSDNCLKNLKSALDTKKPILFGCSNFALFYLMTFCKQFELVESITFIKANDSKLRRKLDSKLSECSGTKIESIAYDVKKSNYSQTLSIMRLLQDNRHIGCLLDIAARNTQTLEIDFLGEKMIAPKSAFNLAIISEAIVVPVMVVRNDNSYEIFIEKHITTDIKNKNKAEVEVEVRDVAQKYYNLIGKKVKNIPSKWSSWDLLQYVRVKRS